jgi:fructuronate reductase
MKLSLASLKDKSGWEKAGVRTPNFDIPTMRKQTDESPVWIHFGTGNFFRGFIAPLVQRLLESKDMDSGIVAVKSFDYEVIRQVFEPYDNLTLNVLLGADGSLDCEIIGSIAEVIGLEQDNPLAWQKVEGIFQNPSLQMLSLTITEKGYSLYGADGTLLPSVKQDMAVGPGKSGHIIGILTGMLYRRYLSGRHPLAMISMDNCAENGTLLGNSIGEVAKAWEVAGHVDAGFLDYLSDERSVSYPWTMIDKITPRPDETVAAHLKERGIEGMDIIVTAKNSFIAPFVNAERPQYLVIEDKFPAGRPPLEKVGVYLTTREIVSKTERMKVTTCLNPLHTAMSIFGCLLGYTRISEEMKDPDIVALIQRLGYVEGLPVVEEPGILSPKEFLDEVVKERFPNPFMPDAPQRIVTDTSQKVGVRFGETIKSYVAGGLNLDSLVAIPLSIAGWFRYLLAVDDNGQQMDVSPDPLLDEMQGKLVGVIWNDPNSYNGQCRDILCNTIIFGSDLTSTSLADKVEEMFIELLKGPGAVRNTLQKYLG